MSIGFGLDESVFDMSFGTAEEFDFAVDAGKGQIVYDFAKGRDVGVFTSIEIDREKIVLRADSLADIDIDG